MVRFRRSSRPPAGSVSRTLPAAISFEWRGHRVDGVVAREKVVLERACQRQQVEVEVMLRHEHAHQCPLIVEREVVAVEHLGELRPKLQRVGADGDVEVVDVDAEQRVAQEAAGRIGLDAA